MRNETRIRNDGNGEDDDGDDDEDGRDTCMMVLRGRRGGNHG